MAFGLFENVPIMTVKPASEVFTQASFATVNRAIQRLVTLGLLHLASSSKKTRLYVYQAYIAILKDGM